jgi:hypothetical protein
MGNNMDMRWQTLFQAQSSIIDRLQRELHERRDVWSIFRDSVVAVIVNRAAEDKRRSQQRAVLQHRLIALWPALLNMFFAREVVPQALEDTAIIEAVFDRLNEESMEMMLKLLGDQSPELAGLVAYRWERHKNKRAQEKIEQERIATEVTGLQ